MSGLLNRTPEKYEAKAMGYERRNKTAKAIKYREKAARLRANKLNGSGVGVMPTQTYSTVPTTYTTTSTTTGSPILNSGFNSGTTGFNNGLGSNTGLNSGLGTTGLNSGLGSNTGLNSGLNSGLGSNTGLNSGLGSGINNTGLNSGLGSNTGLNSGLGSGVGTTGLNSGLGSGVGTTGLNSGLGTNTGLNSGLNSGLGTNTGLNSGLNSGSPILGGNQWTGNNVDWNNWSTQRQPSLYEQNALKWEQRGNWNKAQKNREKYWRLQNPQYNSFAAPQFYQNNQFMGYNQPHGLSLLKGQQGLGQQGLVGQQGFQQGLVGQQGLQQYGQNATFAQPIVQQVVRPTIVEQTMVAEKITQVQPIIHRQIDAPQVHLIEKHVYETVPSTGPSTLTNAPIIQEVVKPHIIEEIQPVVHRQVPQTFVERVEQHVTEHIVKPTITTKEIQQGGIVQQPFVAAGGAPVMGGNVPVSNAPVVGQTGTTQGGILGNAARRL